MEETMQSNWCSVFTNTMELIQNYNNSQYYVDEHVMDSHMSADQQSATCTYPVSSANSTYSHVSTPNDVHNASKSLVTSGGQTHEDIQNIKTKRETGHISFYSKNILKATFDKIQENCVTSSNDKSKSGEQNVKTQVYENCKRKESSGNVLKQSQALESKTSSIYVDTKSSSPRNYNAQQEAISAYQQGSDSQLSVHSTFHHGSCVQGSQQHVTSSDSQRLNSGYSHQENNIQKQGSFHHYGNDAQEQVSGSGYQNINAPEQIQHHVIAPQHEDIGAFQRIGNAQYGGNGVCYPVQSYCNSGLEQNSLNVWQGANDNRSFHMNSVNNSLSGVQQTTGPPQTSSSQNGTPELYQVNVLPNGQSFLSHNGVSRSQTRKRRITGQLCHQNYSMSDQKGNHMDSLLCHDVTSGHSMTESDYHNSSTPHQSPHSYTNKNATLQHTPHPEHVAGRFVRRKRQLCNRNYGLRTNSNTSNLINQADFEIKNSSNVSNDTPSTTANSADGQGQSASLWQPWL